MSQSSKVRSSRCDFCEHSTCAEAKHGCKQCKAYFCHACLRNYHSRGAYRKHDVLAVDEYQTNEGNVCSDHNEALKLFCESCMESLCCECKFLGRHADHRVVHLQKYATELKDDFHKLLIDMSAQGLEGECKEDIDVTLGVERILNKVQKSFAERKKNIDNEMRDLVGELGKVWTAINEKCDREHSFISKTFNSALNIWKKMGTDAESIKEQKKLVSGLKVIKHRMIQSRSDHSSCSQGDVFTVGIPLHDCIWQMPRGSTEAFESVCWNSSFSRESSDLDVNTRLVNICAMEECSDISQEELRLDDYILGRVKDKVLVLPQWLSLLKGFKYPSKVHVGELLSTFKLSAMTQSQRKSSFAMKTLTEQTNEISSLLATKPTGVVKISTGSQLFFAPRVGLPVASTSVKKTAAVSHPQPSGTGRPCFVSSLTQAQQQSSSVGLNFGSTSPSAPASDKLKSVAEKSHQGEIDDKLGAETPKNVGFSIKSTPTVQETNPAAKLKESKSQDTAEDLTTNVPDPFENFRFRASKGSPDAKLNACSQQPPATTTTTKQPLCSSVSSTGPTFEFVPSSNQASDLSSQSSSSRGIGILGKPLFQNQAAKDRSSDYIKEYEPGLNEADLDLGAEDHICIENLDNAEAINNDDLPDRSGVTQAEASGMLPRLLMGAEAPGIDGEKADLAHPQHCPEVPSIPVGYIGPTGQTVPSYRPRGQSFGPVFFSYKNPQPMGSPLMHHYRMPAPHGRQQPGFPPTAAPIQLDDIGLNEADLGLGDDYICMEDLENGEGLGEDYICMEDLENGEANNNGDLPDGAGVVQPEASGMIPRWQMGAEAPEMDGAKAELPHPKHRPGVPGVPGAGLSAAVGYFGPPGQMASVYSPPGQSFGPGIFSDKNPQPMGSPLMHHYRMPAPHGRQQPGFPPTAAPIQLDDIGLNEADLGLGDDYICMEDLENGEGLGEDYICMEDLENGEANNNGDLPDGAGVAQPEASGMIPRWQMGAEAPEMDGAKAELPHPKHRPGVPGVPGAGLSAAVDYFGPPGQMASVYSIPGQSFGPGFFADRNQAGLLMQGALFRGQDEAAVGEPFRFHLPAVTAAINNSATRFPLSMPEHAAVDGSMIPTAASQVFPATKITTVISPQRGVTSTSPSKPRHDTEHSESEADNSYREPECAPLITLPEKVDVVTGEEDENCLFENRAKLFRFSEQQWKERGLGNIKILHNKNTQQVRILMRREQKVCANHLIKADTDIAYKNEDDKKVLTWRAVDHTDNEPCMEQFCVKFKTEELTAQFKDQFEAAKQIASQKPQTSRPAATSVVPPVTTSPPSQTPPKVTTASSQEVPKTTSAVSYAFTTTGQSSSIPRFGPPTTVASTTVMKTAGFTVAVSHPQPSGTGSFVFGSTPAQQQPLPGGFSFGSTSSTTPASDMLKSVIEKSCGEETEGWSGAAAEAPKNVFGGFSFKSTPSILFGGFSFKSTPSIQETKQPATPEESKPQDTAKDMATKPPNPFVNFSFGAVKSSPDSQQNASPPQPSAASATSKQPLFSSAIGTTGPTFASLASSNQPADFSTRSSSSQGFGMAGKPLFQNQSPGTKDRSSDYIEEYEPEVDFKPFVSLPEVTDHKTGEEDETKLFGHRAKLFRHDAETMQWKERGVDEIKILRNETTGRCRILMRREQVLKLCANHTITKDMKLAPLASSDKAWCWFAQDYSEEEMKTEQLAAKFKTQDLALRFKEAFEKCQATMVEQKSEASSTTTTEPAESARPKVQQSLAEQFKAKEGEWICSGCYVRNKPETDKCLACMGPKDPPPQPPPASVLRPMNSSAPPFKFQPGQQALADLVKAKEGEWECNICMVRNKLEAVKCVACETPHTDPSISIPTGLSSTTKSTSSGGGLKFKEAFEKCQATMVEQTSEVSSTATQPAESVRQKVQQSLAEQFKAKEGEWDCSGCYVRNKPETDKCIACMGPKDPPPQPPPASVVRPVNSSVLPFQLQPGQQSLADLFKAKEGEWDCSWCFVRNKPETDKCVACMGPKDPPPQPSPASVVPPVNSSVLPFQLQPGQQSLADLVKTKEGEWDCSGCYVRNKPETDKCVACMGPKDPPPQPPPALVVPPVNSSALPFQLQPGQQSLADLFKAEEEEWECNICLVRNKPEAVKCVACETPNPDAISQTGVSYTTTFEDAKEQEEDDDDKYETWEKEEETDRQGESKNEKGEEEQEEEDDETRETEPQGENKEEDAKEQEVEDDDEDETDEQEEEGTDEVLFRKRVTLNYMIDKKPKMAGMGEMLLVVDDDVDGAARVKVTSDKGKLLCNHVICQQHTLAKSGNHKFCEWTAKDFSTDEPIKRTFRAYFSSDAAATEFSELFKKAVYTARELDISEIQDGCDNSPRSC